MGEENAQAGSGIWFGDNDPRNEALRVPGKMQTNQVAELYAILHVVKNTPSDQPLHIKSDSMYAIEILTKHHTKMEDKGWIGIDNYDLIKAIIAWLRSRQSATTFQWIKGHNGEEGNEGADKLAAEGALLPATEYLDLTAPLGYTTCGAKLASMSGQRLRQSSRRCFVPSSSVMMRVSGIDGSMVRSKSLKRMTPSRSSAWEWRSLANASCSIEMVSAGSMQTTNTSYISRTVLWKVIGWKWVLLVKIPWG
jgi:ribonuclease HI